MPGAPISYLQQIMARQAQGGPRGGPPPTMAGVEESEADRLYRLMLSQGPQYREPSTMERIAAGLMVPSTPIRHRDVGGRMFLRGLVGGFKGSRGFGIPGQGALSRAALTGQLRGGGGYGGITPYQLASLQFRERADLRAEENSKRQWESLRSLIPQREASTENIEARTADIPIDNARADAGQAETRRHHGVMESQSAARLRIAQQNASRLAKSTGGGASGSTSERKAYWDAQADVMEAGINAKFEQETAGMRPSSRQKRALEAKRDADIQQVKAWRARQVQTISAQAIEGKTGVNPEPEGVPSLPDGLDVEDFDQ